MCAGRGFLMSLGGYSMKRRVLSFILTLALCLNLCPVWAWATDAGTDGLCPHHPEHTAACGYVSPTVGQECTHTHDENCEQAETGCIHEHDDTCGYVAGDSGAPCAFVCRICPIEDLIDKLPSSVSEDNSEQVQAQLSEIYALYEELTGEEQQQVDMTPCAALLDQIDGMGDAVLGDGDIVFDLPADQVLSKPYQVSGPGPWTINMGGHTLSVQDGNAIQVTEEGKLYLKGSGTVDSPKAIGIVVEAGCLLNITDPGVDITVQGRTYALDIASGATVQLSTGTYTGRTAAIHTADGNYAALLAPGYTYFDADGNPLLPADVATATTVVIGACTEHVKDSYKHEPGTTKHTWICSSCKLEGPEETCTFDFQNVTGTCICGNTLTIGVDESSLGDLIYDSTDQTANVTLTVTLGDGTELTEDVNYKVSHSTRVDVGEITVTVTGITFNGTFTKTYQVAQDTPGIKWTASTLKLEYDGRRTTIKDELPEIEITIRTPNNEDLRPYIQYSYREFGGNAEFTNGLPLDAGEYEIKAYLPESQNYEAAETDPCLHLTIEAINPVKTAPEATQPTYNGTAQELVTAGVVDERAVGAEILFATGENGSYSTTIPTGIDAGDYEVWYKVVGTDNYNAVGPTQVADVKILRKQITPVVTLSEYKYLYDGGRKEPTVTVKDEDHVTVLLDTEYQVKYENNRNVSTEDKPAKVIVTDQPGGNYELEKVEAPFQITSRTQETLTINNKPNTVIYGDQFTLETSGGSGNGDVTWEITDGTDVAQVDENSGQVTIIGDGTATVKATKSGQDPDSSVVNYEDATASWKFIAAKKAVTATVTAENRFYNGTTTATIRAVVEQGVLPNDEITITGLTGTFDNENAGENKTVTVVTTGATINGHNCEHYNVSYSNAPVKATIYKAIVSLTPPVSATLTYNGSEQALITTGAAVADPTVVVDPGTIQVEYALSEAGPYSTTFPKAMNAGTYTVYYRVQETDNYTGVVGQLPAKVNATISKKSVAPTIVLNQDSFVYDGTAKEPVVTLTDDGNTIPTNEYTVEYIDNVNVGSATVTVTAKDDGNYTFTPASVTKNFTIDKTQAQVITAPEAAGEPLTFNTRAQKLVTAGTGSGGTMVYSTDNTTFTANIPTETNAAEYMVYYKVQGDANHGDSAVGSVKVTIAPKTVKDPTIELYNGDDALVSYTYDGTAKKPTAVVKDGSTVIDTVEYEVVYGDNIDAGKATVNITAKPGGNYIVTGSATFVIVKADIVFNPKPSAAAITYDGKPHELLEPGTTSGGEVLYALGSATSSYTAAIPTATEAGNYTVYYKVVGDKNHNDFAVQSVDVTIQRKPLTAINIALTPDSFTYDGTVKLPEVKVMDGKTVLPEEEYDWSCNDTAPTNEGTYTITITDAAGGNYDLTGVTQKTANFTIDKTDQEALVIEGKPAITNYGNTFQLTVSGGNGDGNVSWEATGAATVDADGNVTITNVGEATITVKKAAGTNYTAAQAQWTFTATPRPVNASVTVADKPFDGKTTAAVASASIPTVNGDTVTIDPTSITATFDTPSVGTGKTVTLDTSKVQVTGADVAKYAISYPDTVTASITQAMTQITTAPAANAPLTYNGQPQALVTAGETNVGFLVYSLDGTNFSPEIPTGTNAGTYSVYYKVDATTDYTGVDVNATAISVTIAPKSITPTISPETSSFVYDGTKKAPVIVVKDGNTVIDDTQYTVTWKNDDATAADDVLLTAVGEYTATIKNVANGNYSFTATAKAEIVAAAQTALHITGKPDHVYYGDTVTTLGTTGGTGEGTVKWSITAGNASATINETTGELTIKGIGSITVKAERAVPNYATVTDTWTFTVEPKPVVADVTITSKDYDGTTDVANSAITATVKASDLVDSSDSFTISGLTGTYDDANVGTSKTVTLDTSKATTTADSAKYTVSYPATAKADITAKSTTVTATLSGNDLQQEQGTGTYYYAYDGTEKRPIVTVTADDGKVLAFTDYGVSYSDNKNVGTATVTVTAKADGNYTFADKEVKFDIREANAVLTSTPKANNLTYTGQAQELVTVGTATGGTVLYSETGAPDSYSAIIPQETNAGTYTVYYMVKGDGNHADTTPGQVSVTIKSKEIISPKITLSQDSYVYDGNACEPTVTVQDGTETIANTEYNVTYRDNINAGTATVLITNANGGNYIVNGTATFAITKKAPTFTAPAGKTGLQYNGEPQELVTAGGSSEGTMVYSLDGVNYSPVVPTATAVGTYTITYKVLGDANHSDTAPTTLNVEIAKNTVNNPTISLSSDTFQYNGNQQKPTITVYDDSSRLIPGNEYTVTITGTNGNNMVDVDTYTITVTTPASFNYDIQGNNTRTFKIVPAGQETLSITGTEAQVFYGNVIQLGTTGGTGSGTVTWTVTGSGTISSTINATGLLTVKDVNSPITVTATRSAGGNYDDVSATWEFTAAKKPVTADVTIAPKNYDGTNNVANADITATVKSSDLVSGDSITISGLTAIYDNENVGTDKKVTVNHGSVSVAGTNAEKYDITYPATTTASILKANVTNVTAPTAATGLEYTGNPLTLVATAGSSPEGILEYSLDNTTYSTSLPTGTDAGDYDIWYRVKGDSNHNDTAAKKLDNQVTIAQQNVTAPIIEFTPSGASYDGKEHKPTVTVKDDAKGRVIPDSEYTVTYVGADWTTAGKHKVTITNNANGNYIITDAEKEFEITPMGQNPLSIVNQPGRVQYGDSFTLSATGGSGTGAVTWESSNTAVATIDQNGLVKVLKSGGPVTITAKKLADGNFGQTTATWAFSAEKKPVTPIVTAQDKVYNGNDKAELDITWQSGDLLKDDTIDLTSVLTGKFNTPDVGTNKKVTISGTAPDSEKYDITIPATTTASITPAVATVVTAPTKVDGLTYNGSPKALVNEGTATGGYLVYSLDGRDYSLSIPEETNAGKYTVWYKVQAQAGGNYQDSRAFNVVVNIAPRSVTSPEIELSSDTFEYDGNAKKPDVVVKDGNTVIPTSEYTVSYRDNVQIGTNATVTITDVEGGNYTVSGSKTFTIKAATASLKDAPQPNSLTYNGSSQALVTPGTAVNGRVVYSTSQTGTYTTSIPRETNAGSYDVWYKVEGDNGASDTTPDRVSVTIQRKQVTPTILLNNQYAYSTPYTGSAETPTVTVIVDGQQLSGNYTTIYSNNKDVGTATVSVQSTGGNYQFYAVATFEITKSKAQFLLEPKARTGLVYTGEAQELVEAGVAKEGGIVLYSLDDSAYSTLIPTGTEKGSYVVFAKVRGSSMYEESDVVAVRVKIDTNPVNTPGITLSQNSFSYTGSAHMPTVTVTDDEDNVIPASEYTVSYENNVNVGTATVTVKSRGSNYSFTGSANFQIIPADQTPLTITGKQDTVYYGDTLNLSTTGGSGNGVVTWSSSDTNVADIVSATGAVTIKKSGSVTITATKSAGGGYGEATDTWTFYVQKKPVTAVVTAADKGYDGNNSATLSATISGGLVGSDMFTVTATGHFADVNVGTNKTVIIDSLNIPDDFRAKYDISYPDTITASITPAAATVGTAPTAVTGLTYTGSPLALVSAGTATDGNLMYSLDGNSYSFNLPTGTDAGSYAVWYKVVAADENHKDSAPEKVGDVTIAANTDTPTVLCTPSTFQYDGTEKTPTIVVRDSAQRVIPESEYTVTLPSNRIAVNTYTVTVTDTPGGNYDFTSAPATGSFEIVAASQNPLSIVTDKPTDIYYGDTFRLSAMGGSGSGAIKWSVDDTSVATIDDNGVVTVKGINGFTVKAYREAADGYSQSNTDSVPFVVHQKPVTPVVTAEDRAYDGTITATLKADWKSGDLVGTDAIVLAVEGEFASADVGASKQVKVTKHEATGADVAKYAITWPATTTASIYKVDAKLATAPSASALTYTGSPQPLVTGGTTEGNIGKIVYSLSQNGTYAETIPTGTDAGKYTVWYKVADSVNYTGIAAASIGAEIEKATPNITANPTASGSAGQPLSGIALNGGAATANGADVSGSFAWKDGTTSATSGTEYDVIFTPDDIANYNTATTKVQAVASSTSSSTNSAPMKTTIQNGTANTVLSAAGGRKLVSDAIANQSEQIVIKPEITSDVTKAQVSIPSSTVSQIKNETNAALTVSVPHADVTIPNAALDTLSSAGGTVNVVTEQVDQAVVLTLTADGKPVDSVPGGVKLTVPAEDAGPGTVAVLVHEDGTREIVRKSVAEDGKVNIPLDGSATVEIVDNSKEFSDVPDTNWAADAVSFASAHEMFNGTSETTFSPDQSMSRGMLATVLYNLEGSPSQDTAGSFDDVGSDAWYADGVAWAAENGIVDGYGDGQFGPDDSITREQFAVMLWKYAGSPKASGQDLAFTDADQASGYAQEALCWAVENGILSGYNGQLAPKETATRAQAAQMLKRFMENT